MGANDKAVGFLELNSQQWDDALAAAGKALVAFGAALASYKTADFFKDGIDAAIKFGNEAYFAAQKLNGFDAGNLFIVQKALERSGESASEATANIESFGRAGRPLAQLFKGGESGFGQALTEAAKEYGTQAAVLSKSAEQFAYVEQQIVDIGTKVRGFFLGMADQISKPLSELLNQLDKIDLVSMGEQFGGYVVNAINVVRGLIKQGNLFEVLGLSLKVGFEIAVDFLMQPALWGGIAKVAVGALALIGNFLTSVFLGIGKLLIATIQAAFERLRETYGPLLAIISPAAGLANALGAHASTDVGENLRNLEGNSLIKSQDAGARLINGKALDTAMSGIADFIKAGKNTNLSGEDSKKLEALLSKALATGEAQNTSGGGKKTPTFSETADPFHVIADSLARVGGGGRYVRTGLSIAEKAAMDSARYNKQQADLLQKYLPYLKNTSKPATMGGG